MSATSSISRRSVFETAAAARPAEVAGDGRTIAADGHDHASGHTHDHGDHGHRHTAAGHHHRPGRDHSPRHATGAAVRPVRIAPSLIRAGLGPRLGGAAVLLAVVWGLTALVTG